MIRIIGLLIALCALPAVWAGTETGVAAYNQGDFSAALSEYKSAATQGDKVAQYLLARMYFSGEGAPQNYPLAIKWYQQSAEAGYAPAQFALGQMLERRQGVRRSSFFTALNWIEKAANQEYVPAMYAAAMIYAEGNRVPPNLDRAIEWFRKAAAQGHVDATYQLARFYELGLDSDLCSRPGAPRSCRTKRRSGETQAIVQDHKQAFALFKQAAEKEHINAQIKVGLMYEQGLGVTKDLNAALEWYKKAADKGSVEAAHKLSVHKKAVEIGGKKQLADDRTRAAELRSAYSGSLDAQLNVAKLYAEGIGVPRNYVQAYIWFNIAAAAGSDEARKKRDQLKKNMTSKQVADAQKLTTERLREIKSVQ